MRGQHDISLSANTPLSPPINREETAAGSISLWAEVSETKPSSDELLCVWHPMAAHSPIMWFVVQNWKGLTHQEADRAENQ